MKKLHLIALYSYLEGGCGQHLVHKECKGFRSITFRSAILYAFLIKSLSLEINQNDWKKEIFLLDLNELTSSTCNISSKASTKFIFIAEFPNSRSVKGRECLLHLRFSCYVLL